MADPEVPPTEDPKSDKVFERFLNAHNLDARHVLSFKVVGGQITAVTEGGQKIVWRPGQKPVVIPASHHPDAKPPERKKAEEKEKK